MVFSEWVDSKGGLGCRKADALWRGLAAACGVSYHAVYKWYRGMSKPSLNHILTLEEATSGKVKAHDWSTR